MQDGEKHERPFNVARLGRLHLQVAISQPRGVRRPLCVDGRALRVESQHAERDGDHVLPLNVSTDQRQSLKSVSTSTPIRCREA